LIEGPTSISLITSGSTYTTAAAFKDLVDRPTGIYSNSTQVDARRKTNPFYVAERAEWLRNPTLPTLAW